MTKTAALPADWRDFLALTKPRVMTLVVFTGLCGMLAGSMTDPPALAFASSIAGSDAPTVAYATVFPLTMLMRILSAQVLAIVLFR